MGGMPRGWWFGWLVLGAGVIGAVLGINLWTPQHPWQLLLVLVVSTGLGVAVTLGWLVEPKAPAPPQQHQPIAPPASAPPVPQQIQPALTPPPPRAEAPQPVTPTQDWWDRPSPTDGQAPTREPPPRAQPLETFLPQPGQVAQCPRCGDFDLDVQRDPDDFLFHCTHCDNEWRWAPGTPPLPMVVRRSLAPRPDANSRTDPKTSAERQKP